MSLQQQHGNEQLCSFAVRSGGHTPWAGAANSAGGVVIDLRSLNAIELDVDHSTVSVGVGASWDMVYTKLDPLGLSVNGARAASVGELELPLTVSFLLPLIILSIRKGVGGLTLGGGISYFSPRYGWTCDTVTNFEIVLADGSIVNTNPASNKDLFQTLKGGNNNFGIVTRVDLTTFEQGPIWVATNYYNLTLVDEVIAQLVQINSPTAYDEHASLSTTFAYSQAQNLAIMSSNLQYTKPVENPPVYKGFYSLPSLMSTSRITNMSSLAIAVEALQPGGSRRVQTPRPLWHFLKRAGGLG